jgi:putative peptidoglycan lipid II flippase
MGFCLYAGAQLLGPALQLASWRYLALAALVAIGIVSYFTAAQLLGALRITDLRRTLRR